MTVTYRSDHAADPVLFERLMRERYGPLDRVIAERNRTHPPELVRRQRLLMATAYLSHPDPDAAEHYAQLKEAVAEADGRSRARQRPPPFPGATWCNSCDGWCTTQGICGCNNR